MNFEELEKKVFDFKFPFNMLANIILFLQKMTTLINFNLKKKTGVCIFPDNKNVRKFVISKDKKK